MSAPAIDLEILTPAQELYRAEKARRIDRVQPAISAAAAELQRLDDQAREARKGGRPRGPQLVLGKARRPRGLAVGPEPDAPGRPEWLTPPTPVREDSHPEPRPTMPRGTPSNGFAPKACAHCDDQFTPKGSRQIFCSDECKGAAKANYDAPAPKKTAAKKTEKPEKKKRRISTGFIPSTSAARSSSLADAISSIEDEISQLDERREKLIGMADQLRELEAA